MSLRKFAVDLAITFGIVLVVSAAVTFLYSLVVHGQGVIDWETAFRFALILGIVLPWLQQRKK